MVLEPNRAGVEKKSRW